MEYFILYTIVTFFSTHIHDLYKISKWNYLAFMVRLKNTQSSPLVYCHIGDIVIVRIGAKNGRENLSQHSWMNIINTIILFGYVICHH